MAATFVEKATGSTVDTNTMTISKPTGTVDGHVMISAIMLLSVFDSINSVPSGWTQVFSKLLADGVHTLTAWRKVAASEGASYQWGFTGDTWATGGIATYSGVDNTTPIDVSGSQANDSDSTSVTAPTITTTADNEIVIYIGGSRWSEPTTWTEPASTTERLELSNPSSGGPYNSIEFAEYTKTTAGATGTKTATINVSTRSIAGQIALKNAAAGAFKVAWARNANSVIRGH